MCLVIIRLTNLCKVKLDNSCLNKSPDLCSSARLGEKRRMKPKLSSEITELILVRYIPVRDKVSGAVTKSVETRSGSIGIASVNNALDRRIRSVSFTDRSSLASRH